MVWIVNFWEQVLKNILVLGKGFISSSLPFENKHIDKVDPDRLFIRKNIIDKYKPDIIINCIGRTGSPNVDWCEEHKSETAEANVALPINLAIEAEKSNIHLIHLGSGCIFYGRSPHAYKTGQKDNPIADPGWKEDDFANPLSFYSKTKYSCDLALGQFKNVCTLRLRMPVSGSNNPRNLLSKIINYKKVVEENNSITFIDDLVNAIRWVSDKGKTGIYHIASPEPLKHSVFLEEYKKYVPNHSYESISSYELNELTIAPRSNCILNVDKVIKEGFVFLDTDACARAYVKLFINNRNL